EIERLTTTILKLDNDAPDAVVDALKERHVRLREVDGRIRAAQAAPGAIDMTIRRMERDAKKRIADIAAALDRNRAEARGVLESLLTEPIQLRAVETPAGKRFELEGELGLAPLLAVEAGEFSLLGATFEIWTAPQPELRVVY